MVWSVKYRRKVLSPEIEAYIQKLAVEIGMEKGFTVDMLEVCMATTRSAEYHKINFVKTYAIN